MSFVIVAAALAWEAYQSLATGAALWRTGVDLFGGAAAAALAFAGVRSRHRMGPR